MSKPKTQPEPAFKGNFIGNQNDFYKTILDKLPTVVFLNEHWKEGDQSCLKFLWANKATFITTDFTENDLMEMGDNLDKKTLHEEDFVVPQLVFDYFSEPENSQNPLGIPYRYRNKAGEFKWAIDVINLFSNNSDYSRLQLLNCLVTIDDALQIDRLLHFLFADQRRKGKKEVECLLTKCEVKVLVLIGRGLNNRAMATELDTAINTVKSHVRSLREKLNIRSLQGLCACAIKHGFDSF